jgi:LysR family nod box-dependent transcriptional activator
MRFNKLDLNLLVALDVLLKERSITRAAERLNLSPSAMSSSLARLREYFDDELLVQYGRKMEMTPRAASLQDAVRDVLLRIESTIGVQPAFEPSQSDRVFRIFASDYTQVVLTPHLLQLASDVGCMAQFEFLHQVAHPHKELERGEADLLIIPSGFLSPDHPSEVLYREDFVCVVWRDGPLARDELSFERYLSAGHVVMQPPGRVGISFENWFFQRFGVTRRVAVTTYSFAAMPAAVIGTPFVATVHRRLARQFARHWPLVVRETPVAVDAMDQGVQWHKYRAQDPGLVWLLDLMRRAVQQMDATDTGMPVARIPSA